MIKYIVLSLSILYATPKITTEAIDRSWTDQIQDSKNSALADRVKEKSQEIRQHVKEAQETANTMWEKIKQKAREYRDNLKKVLSNARDKVIQRLRWKTPEKTAENTIKKNITDTKENLQTISENEFILDKPTSNLSTEKTSLGSPLTPEQTKNELPTNSLPIAQAQEETTSSNNTVISSDSGNVSAPEQSHENTPLDDETVSPQSAQKLTTDDQALPDSIIINPTPEQTETQPLDIEKQAKENAIGLQSTELTQQESVTTPTTPQKEEKEPVLPPKEEFQKNTAKKSQISAQSKARADAYQIIKAKYQDNPRLENTIPKQQLIDILARMEIPDMSGEKLADAAWRQAKNHQKKLSDDAIKQLSSIENPDSAISNRLKEIISAVKPGSFNTSEELIQHALDTMHKEADNTIAAAARPDVEKNQNLSSIGNRTGHNALRQAHLNEWFNQANPKAQSATTATQEQTTPANTHTTNSTVNTPETRKVSWANDIDDSTRKNNPDKGKQAPKKLITKEVLIKNKETAKKIQDIFDTLDEQKIKNLPPKDKQYIFQKLRADQQLKLMKSQ